MAKKEDSQIDVKVRLTLDSTDDKEVYSAFIKIKDYLGQKLNTEVARFCIMRTYEKLKEERKVS